MANSTQRYVDNEKSKSFISGILNQEPVGVVQEVDIDLDVEKKISELQEPDRDKTSGETNCCR